MTQNCCNLHLCAGRGGKHAGRSDPAPVYPAVENFLAGKIRNMVSVQIPGIPLRALMVAPRQLPYHSGFSYFELDKSGQAWTEMAAAGAVALHVSGSFPDLNMQLWAIRG